MRRGLSLVMAGLIGIASAGAVSAPARAADPAPAPTRGDIRPRPSGPADWMYGIYATKPSMPLSKMIIPGTHDSGAYAIPVSPPCKLMTLAGGNPIYVAAAKANPCGAAKLAKAQSGSLGDQLNAGIRYLDLRVGVPLNRVVTPAQAKIPAKDPAAVPLYLQHSYISVKLTTGLTDVLAYAAGHPREQVILDFQHLDFPKDPTVANYYRNALYRLLQTYKPLGLPTVCSRAWSTSAMPGYDTQIGNIPVGKAWIARKNLIVLFAAGEMFYNDCFRQRELALNSPWPNTQDPAVSVAKNTQYLKTRKAALAGALGCYSSEGYWCGMFVNQMQLSVQLGTQAKCLFSTGTPNCSLLAYAYNVNNDVPGELFAWRFQQSLPTNIAIVDFFGVGRPSYTTSLINMNRRLAG